MTSTRQGPVERVRFLRFKVRGRGPFPLDMLRYDHCWPSRQADVSSLIASLGPRSRDQEVEVQVSAWNHQPMTAGAAPTTARWKSFGWVVTEVDRS